MFTGRVLTTSVCDKWWMNWQWRNEVSPSCSLTVYASDRVPFIECRRDAPLQRRRGTGDGQVKAEPGTSEHVKTDNLASGSI